MASARRRPDGSNPPPRRTCWHGWVNATAVRDQLVCAEHVLAGVVGYGGREYFFKSDSRCSSAAPRELDALNAPATALEFPGPLAPTRLRLPRIDYGITPVSPTRKQPGLSHGYPKGAALVDGARSSDSPPEVCRDFGAGPRRPARTFRWGWLTRGSTAFAPAGRRG